MVVTWLSQVTTIVGALYHKLQTQSSAPVDGRNHRPKHVELIEIIIEMLLLHLVVCLYYFTRVYRCLYYYTRVYRCLYYYTRVYRCLYYYTRVYRCLCEVPFTLVRF